MDSDKEIDNRLDKLFSFLDQFDYWWISGLTYNYEDSPHIIVETQKIQCIDVKEFLEKK